MSQLSEEMLRPVLPISPREDGACRGAEPCRAAISAALAGRERVTIVLECYPGVDQSEALELLSPLGFDTVIHADGCALAARVYYQAICAYFGTTPLESIP